MTTPTPPSYFAITASTGLDGVTELTSPWSPSLLVRGQPSSTTTQAVVGNISYAKLGGTGSIGSIMVARASAVGVTLSVISDGDILTNYPLLKDWCTPIHIAPTDSLRVVQTVLSPVEVTLCVGNMQGDVFAQYIAEGLTGVSSLALSNAVAETRSQITWAPDGGGDATTFAEAFTLLKTVANGHIVTVILDRNSSLAPELRVPAGTWDIRNANVTATGFGDPSLNMVILSDGAVIRNAGETFRSCSVRSESSTPTLDYDGLAPGSPPVIFVGIGAFVENAGAAPMYVQPAGGFTILLVQSGVVLPGSAPIIQLGAGGTAYVRVVSGGTIDPSAIAGPASATILFIHDGQIKFPVGPFPGLDPGATILNMPLGVCGGSGPTAFRPFTGDPSSPVSVGCLYTDIDVSKLVVWTGADWVDSATWLPA